MCVCVFVCLGYNFWNSWHRNFIFGMVLHLDHIWVRFEYQGRWVKVKVISWKILILPPGPQFNLVWLAWGQGHTKIKVIPRSDCKCLTFYQQGGGGPSTERHSRCEYCTLLLPKLETRATVRKPQQKYPNGSLVSTVPGAAFCLDRQTSLNKTFICSRWTLVPKVVSHHLMVRCTNTSYT